jgi:hypothetical protein
MRCGASDPASFEAGTPAHSEEGLVLPGPQLMVIERL